MRVRHTFLGASVVTFLWIGCHGGEPAAFGATACTITGTPGDDTLHGTDGSDVICAGAGDDLILANGGSDVIFAEQGNDRIRGGQGRDRISAGPGDDRVNGDKDRDTIRGGRGDDRLTGGDGSDEVRGEIGNDRVSAGQGRNDVVFGGSGADRLNARNGRPYDRLDGGTDTNLCVEDSSDHRVRCKHPRDRTHRAAIPILMYHVIKRARSSTPNPQLYVGPRVLDAQMHWLSRHRYHVVTLSEVYDYWRGGPLPDRPIVVSFDDGFKSQYTHAKPILDRYHWPGTLNLVLSHYRHSWGLGHRRIHRMIGDGWELDSHTMTHQSLPSLSDRDLSFEVGRSRAVLRRLFGVPISFLCYPYGAFDGRVARAARAAGYLGATATGDGLARWDVPFALKRIHVNKGDDVAGLRAKLAALGLPIR